MTNVSYTVLSRQSALEKELSSLANGIANSDTVGFRRDGHIFSEFVSAIASEPSLSQTRIGGRLLSEEQGELNATAAPLDLAIEGEGFFVVDTPRGARLTRAGAFQRDLSGALSTNEGFPVQGEGGGRIALPETLSGLVISADGSISNGREVIGKMRIVTSDQTLLQREGSAFFAPAGELREATGKIRQGFLELSNVSPVLELSRLIEVQRSFELGAQFLQNESERVERAVDLIGGR